MSKEENYPKERSIVSVVADEDVKSVVTDSLKRIEGLPKLLSHKHVAIKPNETWASKIDRSACTQADTLKAVIEFVKEYEPEKITVTGGSGAGETDIIFKVLKLDKVIEKEQVYFFDHNRPPFEQVVLKHGPQKLVMVNPHVFEYDTLISVAQLKVHDSAQVTLSMKNIALSYPAADYYGHPRKTGKNPNSFFVDLHGFIAGMCEKFRIDIALIVGHPAMLETGPIGGYTFEAGIAIASTDFVAADYIGARILGIQAVGHIQYAAQLGLGRADEKNIVVCPVSLKEAIKIFNNRAKIESPYSKAP